MIYFDWFLNFIVNKYSLKIYKARTGYNQF